MSKIIVTGGRGFIGSHLVDRLVEEHEVIVIDNGLSGGNFNAKATYIDADIADITDYSKIESLFIGIDYVYHLAAIARTPWCIKDPVLCYQTNVQGTLNIMEASRMAGVKKVVLSSSNIVYAANTPYKHSKLALESIASFYTELYKLPTVCLRYSNVYGTRQREDGESPNVFAAMRKSKREKDYIEVTGDGYQTRDFTHVSDVVRANMKAMKSDYTGILDVCTGRNVSMNYICELFDAYVKYIPERVGDVKHIIQDPKPIEESIGWVALTTLEEGFKDILL